MAAHRRSEGFTTNAAALLLLHDDPDIKLNINRALNIAESIAMVVITVGNKRVVWKPTATPTATVGQQCTQNATSFFFSLFLLSLWLSRASCFNQAAVYFEEGCYYVLDQLDLCLACYGSTANSILVAARKPQQMSSIR